MTLVQDMRLHRGGDKGVSCLLQRSISFCRDRKGVPCFLQSRPASLYRAGASGFCFLVLETALGRPSVQKIIQTFHGIINRLGYSESYPDVDGANPQARNRLISILSVHLDAPRTEDRVSDMSGLFTLKSMQKPLCSAPFVTKTEVVQ